MTVRDVLNAVIEYETPRYVKVHNPLVGLVLRGSQTLIITYIVGWAILHERGYQVLHRLTALHFTRLLRRVAAWSRVSSPR